MNFDFSDDLKQLRDQARRFLAEQSPPKLVRHVLEGGESYAAALWRGMAEMGWLGAAIPEQYGGAGLGYEGLCVLAEELGRALAPVPFASSAYLATEALLLAGSDAQKRRLLPKLADGSAIGCLALAEGTGNPDPAGVRTRAIGGRLSGSKWPVMDGGIADFADRRCARRSRRDRAVPGRSAPWSPAAISPPSIPAAITRASTLPAPRWNGSARRRAGRWCSVCSSERRSWSRSNRWAAPMPRSKWRATMRRSAMRSAGRSVRSRRSSTSSPMCMSRSNWRGRMRITAPGHCRRMRPNCRWPRRPRGCRRPRRSTWPPRRTSRRMAASASPGTWTAICTIGARSSLRWRSGRRRGGSTALVELLEMRNAA